MVSDDTCAYYGHLMTAKLNTEKRPTVRPVGHVFN